LLHGFLYVALFPAFDPGFAGLILVLPGMLRRLKIVPHQPTATKNATYECGSLPSVAVGCSTTRATNFFP
jgi:NADH:ubiquinone oxidoreductase subunit 3 (subunit A)